MARNLLEQHVYSHAEKPPYPPSLIRLPGYSIFLAAVYSVFGHGNNTAVRIIQSVLDTFTCGLVAMIAYYWQPQENRKRASSIAALALAALCPFTTIYVATILTEVWASLFAVALCLLATIALKTKDLQRALWWWAAAGLVGGLSVFFRPDSGLFVAAVGLTLVISVFWGPEGVRESRPLRRRVLVLLLQGSVLSLAFALVLVPWTVRNWRTFHVFQPLAPTHGQMPGEFVPNGYYAWVRSWLDDRKYIEPMLWSLDESEIDLDELPPGAFDSEEEKARVQRLIDRYNDPQDEEVSDQSSQTEAPAVIPRPTVTPTTAETPDKANAASTPQQTPSPETDTGDESDQADHQDSAKAETPAPELPPEMTPALDAAFGEIARERNLRAPLRHYFWLPLKRARSLWIGPHADYFPFAGELFPLEDLDHATHQQIWLPLFAALVWIYTLLGLAGAWVLWRSPDAAARRWLLLVFLMIFIRLAYFSTMENPEPRYTVEIFPFLAILGGIAIARLVKVRQRAS